METVFPLRTEDVHVSHDVRRVARVSDEDRFAWLDSVSCDLQEAPWRHLKFVIVGTHCESVVVAKCRESDLSVCRRGDGGVFLRFSGFKHEYSVTAVYLEEWPNERGTNDLVFITLQLDRPDVHQRCHVIVTDISIDRGNCDLELGDPASLAVSMETEVTQTLGLDPDTCAAESSFGDWGPWSGFQEEDILKIFHSLAPLQNVLAQGALSEGLSGDPMEGALPCDRTDGASPHDRMEDVLPGDPVQGALPDQVETALPDDISDSTMHDADVDALELSYSMLQDLTDRLQDGSPDWDELRGHWENVGCSAAFKLPRPCLFTIVVKSRMNGGFCYLALNRQDQLVRPIFWTEPNACCWPRSTDLMIGGKYRFEVLRTPDDTTEAPTIFPHQSEDTLVLPVSATEVATAKQVPRVDLWNRLWGIAKATVTEIFGKLTDKKYVLPNTRCPSAGVLCCSENCIKIFEREPGKKRVRIHVPADGDFDLSLTAVGHDLPQQNRNRFILVLLGFGRPFAKEGDTEKKCGLLALNIFRQPDNYEMFA